MENQAATYEEIMLTALAGIKVQLRHPGIEVPHLQAHVRPSKSLYIDAATDLKHT